MKLPLLGQIPIVQSIREGGDNGEPAIIQASPIAAAFEELAKNFLGEVEKRNQLQPPTQKVEIKHG